MSDLVRNPRQVFLSHGSYVLIVRLYFSIEGEYVPKEGDDVSYKLCPLPFNPEKKQGVHVKITHLAPGVSHETWNAERDPTISPRH